MTDTQGEQPDDRGAADTDSNSPAPESDESGLPLESTGDDEPCPKCGAAMRGDDALVCLRCGYDLRTLDAHEIDESPIVVEDESEDPPEPVIRPVATDPWLGLVLLGAAGIALVVGVLTGAEGLFQLDPPDPVGAGPDGPREPMPATASWPQRLTELVRLPVQVGVWIGAAFGALALAAWVWRRPLGSAKAAVARVAGMVAVARLGAFIDLSWRTAEYFVEALIGGAVFFGLSLLMLRLPPRDAGLFVLMTAGGFLVLYRRAALVVFAA